MVRVPSTPRKTGTGSEPGADEPGPRADRTQRWFLPISVALVAALLAAVAFAVLAVRNHDQGRAAVLHIRPTGTPANVSTDLAAVMGLAGVPLERAPGFVLTDQGGRTLSMSGFAGKVVVLEFMDPHCTDICPLVSQEFLDSYHDLGPAARRVVFAAVNVNPFYLGVGSMMAFSRHHQLVTIPDWHFFTGALRTLESVWRDYNIEVEVPKSGGDIIHTSTVFFIDPRGNERYIGTPMDYHTASGTAFLPAGQLELWGRGIALVAKDLLS
jgi:cytochrome oxidase Cu insertion factor (SCO1/SenC/PrrC family)